MVRRIVEVLFILWATLLTGGCNWVIPLNKSEAEALERAQTGTQRIEFVVGVAATQVAERAREINQMAVQGKQITPPAQASLLNPFWDSILFHAQALMGQGDELAKLKKDLGLVREEIAAGQKALAAEHAAHEVDNKKHDAEIAALQSRTQNDMRTIRLVTLGIVGVLVGLTVWLKQFKATAAVVAGGVVVLTLTLLVGWVDAYRFWILGGIGVLVLACVLEILWDWKRRGSLWAALVTSPVEDVTEALGETPPSAPATVTPAPML